MVAVAEKRQITRMIAPTLGERDFVVKVQEALFETASAVWENGRALTAVSQIHFMSYGMGMPDSTLGDYLQR